MNQFRNALVGIVLAALALFSSAATAQPWSPTNNFDPLSTIYSPNANVTPILLATDITSGTAITSCSLVGANTVEIRISGLAASAKTTSIGYTIFSNNTPGGNLQDTGTDTPLATITAISNAGTAPSPLARWSLLTVDSTTKIKQGAFIEVRDTSNSDAVIARGTVTRANGASLLSGSYTGNQPISTTQFAVNWVAAPSTTIVATDKVFFCVPDSTADDVQDNIFVGADPISRFITIPAWAQQSGTLNIVMTGTTGALVTVYRVNSSQKFFNTQ